MYLSAVAYAFGDMSGDFLEVIALDPYAILDPWRGIGLGDDIVRA